MKFRNKLSGEIRPAELREDGIYLYDKTTERWYKYTLYLLAKYWEYCEYYEEPKKYWGIDYSACRKGGIVEFSFDNDGIDEFHKSIGNYFESKEEADKAVQKLKAYRRLKDKGLFLKLDIPRGCIDFRIDLTPFRGEEIRGIAEDLELLFGGEK